MHVCLALIWAAWLLGNQLFALGKRECECSKR